MSAGKRARPSGRGWKGSLVFLTGMAGLVLVAPFAGPWVNQLVSESDSGAVSELSGSSTTAPTPEGSVSPTAPDGGTETDAAGQSGTDEGPGDAVDAIEQCAAEIADVEVAVDAARRGIDHWSAHVQARTDMLAGRISEKKMEAIYDRTRAQGPADHQRFSAAVSHVRSQIPCQDAKGLLDGSTGAPGRDCLVRSQKAEAALGAAQSTMDEWLTHLHHMEKHADGGMRTGKALRLWIQAWRKAPEGISAHEQAAADLAVAPACTSD